MFSVENIDTSTMNIHNRIENKNVSNSVINPRTIWSPFSIPDSPPFININSIQKISNISFLKKLEYQYDEFLEKKCQILMLLNIIDEVFEIRDTIIMRINSLKREQRYLQMRHMT